MLSGIRRRMIFYYLAVIAVVVLVMGTFFVFFFDYFYRENLRNHLYTQARLAAMLAAGEYSRDASAADLDLLCKTIGRSMGVRVTLLAVDGTVLGDSVESPGQMENHLNRPEIQEALRSGQGAASRYSDTLGKDMFYAALHMGRDNASGADQGFEGFIRLAVPLSEIDGAVFNIQKFTFVVLIAATLAALLVGVALSSRITGPLKELSMAARAIAGGNFYPALRIKGRDEMAALAQTIREMGGSLHKKVIQIMLEKNKLDVVIRTADSGIVMVDRGLKIELMNPAAEKLFDLQQADLIGQPVQAALRYYSLFENLQHVYRNGQPRYFEFSLYYPRALTLQVSLMPVIGVKGDIMGVLALFHDLTALRSVEQMRTDFVANVSHELRTPLTAIKGYAETILDRDLTGEELTDFIKIIDREAARLSHLIDSLLELSKIEGHKEPIKKDPLDLTGLLKRALQDVEEQRRLNKMIIKTDFPEQKTTLFGDAEWLRQALVNILDNSIKYGNPGGTIRVSAAADEAIRVEISDDGPGIPEADLPHVFERFYRVDKSRTRKSGGTGLGLAIVKHILEAHGASYSIESEPGRGTTFRISLPKGE